MILRTAAVNCCPVDHVPARRRTGQHTQMVPRSLHLNCFTLVQRVIHLHIYLTSFSQLALFHLNGKTRLLPLFIKRELLEPYKTIVPYLSPAWPDGWCAPLLAAVVF